MSTNRYGRAIWLAGAAAIAALPLHGCKSKPMPLPNASRPRIVAFSPALTQMVVDLGLGTHLVGVTSQCTVPPELHPVVVGDTFNIGVEAILSARPDVVLAQVDPARFAAVRSVEPNIVIEAFNIERMADIPAAVERIGKIAGREDLAAAALTKWREQLDAVEKIAAGKPRPRVLLVMGYRLPSTCGADSFLGDMIERAGGANASADLKPWSQIGLEYAIGAKPDVVVCLLDSATQSADDAREYWQPVLRGGTRPARLVVLTDRKWSIPGLHTAEYVRKLAEILHGSTGLAASGAGQGDAP